MAKKIYRKAAKAMEGSANANPLDTFPAVRSRNSEEVQEALVRTFGARRFDLPHGSEGLNVRANHWQSRNIGVSYCNYGGRVQVEFPGAAFFRLQMCLRGGADIRIDRLQRQVTREETPVIPPGTVLINDFSPGYEQLVLRVDADALTNKLAAAIGAIPRRKLEFRPVTRVEGLESLQRLLMFFISELDSGSSTMPPLALAELEQTLMVSFLCSNPSNYSELLEGRTRPAAPWQVRLAEEYIEAHWDQPITIDALARVTSTSARSLFQHFKRSRGRSPMDFVKEVRLEHARQMLTRTTVETSVTATAFACGFGNLGHFAKDYLKRFGERPSDTVKRGKAR